MSATEQRFRASVLSTYAEIGFDFDYWIERTFMSRTNGTFRSHFNDRYAVHPREVFSRYRFKP